MTTQAATISVRRAGDASFPSMVLLSILTHVLILLLAIVLPEILPSRKHEPFGAGGGGLHVVGVVDFTLGQKGPAARPRPQDEPAPPIFLKKKQLDQPPLESKTSFPEDKVKPKDQPAGTESINVPQKDRKLEGPYAQGTNKSKDAGKSGKAGAFKFGVGPPGAGQGPQGGLGTGTGVPFPFPWYLDNIFTKIELNWRKPYIANAAESYTCVVYFVITRVGQVQKVQVEQSSGIPSLDRSAEGAILGSAPFPPLPTQWTEPDLPFRLTFTYMPE